MPAIMQLDQLAHNHATLRERLRETFGLDEDDQTLADTLDGISDFKELALEALREAKRREAMAEAMKAIIDQNQARKAGHEAASERLRRIVADAMADAGEKKIVAPDMTVSLRDLKPKLAFDLDRLPALYKVEKITYAPNRELIQSAVDNGDVPEGVTIGNGGACVSVRSK